MNEPFQKPEVLIAVIALFVSILSIFLTLVTIWQTKKHNRLSVKPICHIYPPDRENHIAVIIQNNGTGPLISKSIKVYDEANNIKKYLIDLMPQLPPGLYWSDFSKTENFSILPGGQKVLLELKGNDEDPEFKDLRDKVRKRLSEITIEYEFTDIYEQRFPKIIFKLQWFGRVK